MEKNIPVWFKPTAWGAVGGIVIAAIVAFSAGWVVTSSSATEMAEAQTEKALVAALAPICVAQFKSQAQQMQTTQLAALEEESSWQRGDYVEEQGWATMPGGKGPNDQVADACATELMKVAGK